ncbi:MAG: D-alanyl-D-alanine carboxypeptidase [Proteobacteria bacterium]|nr:D-alanyl-D-alanine carboxypeptidase [Pseudomonadota bacterium]
MPIRHFPRILVSGFILCAISGLMAFAAMAARAADTIETVARQAILIDMNTGTVLFEKNADATMPPSSMSKIMTVYMVFERLKDGRLSLDDTFPVSEKAWRKQGSKMWVGVNTRVRVEDLLRGIIVQSGNDATIVVAEGIAGSEDSFASLLNEKAAALGMKNSTFRNASGWPHPEHVTTARDLAVLSQATIRNFPEYYHYYSEKTFTYNGIKQGNRNPTIYLNIGSDGLKTGHTEAAGFGLTASAVRDGRRLMLVINGLPSSKARRVESERLLNWGFREFDNYALFKAGEVVVEANAWMGEDGTVPLIIEDDLHLTIKRKARDGLKVTAVYDGPVAAPIKKGDKLGTLKVAVPDSEVREIPLLAGKDIGQLGTFSRLGAALKFVLWGESN